MKLKDILFETKVFQNNFIKIQIIQDELKNIFMNRTPEIKFDSNGMYIALNQFELRTFESEKKSDKFTLEDAGYIDDIKGIKKYYVSFIDEIQNAEDEPKQENEPKESPPKKFEMPQLPAGYY